LEEVGRVLGSEFLIGCVNMNDAAILSPVYKGFVRLRPSHFLDLVWRDAGLDNAVAHVMCRVDGGENCLQTPIIIGF
jgi:hypothetical protein